MMRLASSTLRRTSRSISSFLFSNSSSTLFATNSSTLRAVSSSMSFSSISCCRIFRCRSNSAFFSSSSRFCFSSRLLRLLTVRPKMSMRSGGDDARSRSRSRRDTAVLVERERERDSRRRFRLLSRDLERFRTRSLSRDRDRDRLRFLLCLLLLVCLERDELRLRDRPILPGEAVTNRWLRAPHVPGYPRLRLRTRAGRPVETGERAAVTQMTSCRSLRSTAATKAA